MIILSERELRQLEELVDFLLKKFKNFDIVYNIILGIINNPEKYKMILNEMDNMLNYKSTTDNYKLNTFINIINGQSKHYNFEREEDGAICVFTKSIYSEFYEKTKNHISYKSFILTNLNKSKEIVQSITPPIIDSYDEITDKIIYL